MKGRSEIIKKLLCLSWLIVLLCPSALLAAPLSYNGTVSYNDSGDDESTTQVQHNLTGNFDQDLTDLTSLGETFRYSTIWQEGRESETLSPSFNLRILNDIFLFGFSGNTTQQRNSELNNNTSSSWQSRWNSAWHKKLWPEIQLDYGQSYIDDDSNPRQIDSKSSNSGFNIDWDLLLADVYYSLRRNENDNAVTGGTNESTSHLARFYTEKSFLQNRFHVTFLEQYTQNDQTTTSVIGSSGFALVQQPVANSRCGWDIDFTTGLSFPNPIEWDALTATCAPPVLSEDKYIAFEVVGSEQVDVIYLYTENDLSAQAGLFTFNVYSSDDGDIWTLQSPAPTPTYNTSQQRFELEITQLNSQYIMLEVLNVDNILPVGNFGITSIEAHKKVFGAVGQEVSEDRNSQNYLTETGVSWKILSDLFVSYNLTLENGTTAADKDTERSNHTTSMRWTPHRFFSSTLSASQSKNDYEDKDETMNRSYGVGVSSQLLPTLNSNFSVTRTESYEAGDKQTTSHDYNLYTNAVFFPDLSSSLDLSYTTSKDEETELLSKSFLSNLRLTARLTPKLTVDLTENYITTKTVTSTWSTSTSLSCNWRPSDILSVQGSIFKEWEKEEGEQPFAYNLSVFLALTRKIQTNYGYTHSETADNYSASLSWTLNSVFSLRASCSYLDSDDNNTFAYGGQLTVRY